MSVDLVAFTQKARDFEKEFRGSQNLVILGLQGIILETIERALIVADLKSQRIFWIQTGDGGIFFIKDTLKAVEAAAYLLQESKWLNEEPLRHPVLGAMHYRIGIATGLVAFGSNPKLTALRGVTTLASGFPIIDAVRLQSNCEPGQLMVRDETFQILPDELPIRRLPDDPQKEPYFILKKSDFTPISAGTKRFENRTIPAHYIQLGMRVVPT